MTIIHEISARGAHVSESRQKRHSDEIGKTGAALTEGKMLYPLGVLRRLTSVSACCEAQW